GNNPPEKEQVDDDQRILSWLAGLSQQGQKKANHAVNPRDPVVRSDQVLALQDVAGTLSPGEAVAAAIHLADAFARPSQSIDPMQVGRALRELVKRLDLLGLVHVLKAPPAPAMPAPSSWKHWPAGRVSHSVRVGTLPIGPVGTLPSWTSPALSTGPGLAKD